jgi:hypothetical protein
MSAADDDNEVKSAAAADEVKSTIAHEVKSAAVHEVKSVAADSKCPPPRDYMNFQYTFHKSLANNVD